MYLKNCGHRKVKGGKWESLIKVIGERCDMNCCSKAISVLSFFGALAIGVAAAYFTGAGFYSGYGLTLGPSALEYQTPYTEIPSVQIEAEDLHGRWVGTWDETPCVIYIERVQGNKFYGDLATPGAWI